MSEHAATAPAASSQSFLEKHHFLLRRLHSLSGIVPVGMFTITHLFTNFQLALVGIIPGAFQDEVDFIHKLPALLFVELGLWGGIGFHAALGIVYAVGSKPNTKSYPYGDNWRYTLQRTTGYIALIFIFLHIATLRWRWNLFGWYTPFDPHKAVESTAIALQHAWWVALLYLVGALSVVFHWCNGLWTAAITWGLTISVNAQKRWGYVCAGLGVALAIFTLGGIGGALKYDLSTIAPAPVITERDNISATPADAPAAEIAKPAVKAEPHASH